MDYLVIGSNGFAQVGSPDFNMKNQVEMQVLLSYLESQHPIPDEFSGMCYYKKKWFDHDFGSYSEIVLIYNNRLVYDWDENDPEKFNRFWDWFSTIEALDLESDEITELIRDKYTKAKQYDCV